MKETIKNFITAASLLVFCFAIYQEVIAPVVNAQDGGALEGTDLTLDESTKMFEELGGEKGETPVTVFVTSWCSVCKALESTLKNAGVKYARADIESSRDGFLYYQRVVKGQTSGIPVTVVGKEVFLGFDTTNIAKAIKDLRKAKKA